MAYTGLDHYIVVAITLAKSFLLTLKWCCILPTVSV